MSLSSLWQLVSPYNPNVPQDVIDKIKAFRNSDIKLNPISMQREIRKMDGKNISGSDSSHHPALSFMYWQKLCWDTEDLPIGFMMTSMMEKVEKKIVGLFLRKVNNSIKRFSEGQIT